MKKRVRFQFEGKSYEVEVERIGDQLRVTGEGQSFTVTLLPEPEGPVRPEEKPQPRVPLPPTYTPEPVDTAPPTAAAPGGEGGGALVAPMTGVVKEIRVNVGHSVERGQVVLVMEAMKMDIDVPATSSGVVAEVSVRAGDSVEARQTLMVIA